jgi:hypothetical protein
MSFSLMTALAHHPTRPGGLIWARQAASTSRQILIQDQYEQYDLTDFKWRVIELTLRLMRPSLDGFAILHVACGAATPDDVEKAL